MLVARCQHAPVMVKLGQGEFPLFRLNARPLQGEAVEGEAQLGEEADILTIAVIVVAGVARRLDIGAARRMLQQPIVVVDVATFHLVRCTCDTPEKRRGKSDLHGVLPFSEGQRLVPVKVKVAVAGISCDEAPISTSNAPASATQSSARLSSEASASRLRESVTALHSPDSSCTLAKAFFMECPPVAMISRCRYSAS